MRAELRLSPTGSGASFAPKSFTFDRPATLELDGHVHGMDFLPAPTSNNAVLPAYALVIDQAFIRYDGSSFTLQSCSWHSDSLCVNGQLLGDRVHALSDGDKLRFGEYKRNSRRFETECAVRVHLSFLTPVPTTTNWPGIRKLIKDIRNDQKQNRPSHQSRPLTSRHEVGTLPSSRIPTSVPTSVLKSARSSTAPAPVPHSVPPSPANTPGISSSSPSAVDHATTSKNNSRLFVSRSYAELIAPRSPHAHDPQLARIATCASTLPSYDQSSTSGLTSGLSQVPAHFFTDSATTTDSTVSPDTDVAPVHPSSPSALDNHTVNGSCAEKTNTAQEIGTDPGPGLPSRVHGQDGAGPILSPPGSVASAVLAISRAHAAWTTARLTLLTTPPSSAAEVPTSGTRPESIDLALGRLRSAWLSMETRQPSCSSASFGTFGAPSTPSVWSPAHGSRPQQIDQLPRYGNVSCHRDHPHRYSVLPTSPIARFPRSPVPPSCSSTAASITSASSALVSSIDLGTRLLWIALLAQVTVILCIFALR